jgi:glucoamylase
MSAHRTLRVELLTSATIHWGVDDWRNVRDVDTCDTGLGVHVADLPTEALPVGARVMFTFLWRDSSRWEDRDFCVEIV